MQAPVEVYCDFDGTITIGDVTDVLLENLADPEWQAIEEQWQAGEISSKECMARQIPLIRGGWQEVTKVLDKVKVDPSFASFAKWCRQTGIPLRIVSDGLDRVINYILQREGIRVDFVWANRLVESENGEFSLLFPYSVSEKVCSSGVCKCKLLESRRANPLRVVIGDGRSDFCWAPEADILFAKSKLAQHCESKKIEYNHFDDFLAIQASLEERLGAVEKPRTSPVFASAS